MLRLNDVVEKVQAYFPEARIELLQKAYVFAAKVHQGKSSAAGEPYLTHPLAVASILADLHMDDVSVACGLLHDAVEDALASRDEVREHFGDEVCDVLEGLSNISRVAYTAEKSEQAENFRRLILSMARDVRVVLIRLADRLHAMRTLDGHPEQDQVALGQETLDIYAPLANRLGIHWLKSELEDLGFRYSLPEVFFDLEEKARRRLAERELYIEEVRQIFTRILEENEIRGRVSGRPKHFYSVYRKMLDQGIGFEKVYDLVAFRLIVPALRDCYALLGAIHSRWTPVPGRFKDYIALPKSNLYQSLHTTVIGPRGQSMEVQIRTEEMHRIAEDGIAAHWRYKEKRATPAPEDRVFRWLRSMVEAHKEIRDPQEFLETIKVELYPDVVYVFTPAGDLVELPRASTPVDFAYAVHTQVGERCVGARVNERMVPLSHKLKNGDRLEIQTSKNHTPSPDWLEFVQTTKARNKIRHWIKTQQRQRSIEIGKETCEREFRKAGKSFSKLWKDQDVEAAAQKFGFNKGDELLEAVGYGKLSARQLLARLDPEFEERPHVEEKRAAPPARARKGIVIQGVGDAMVRFARCCNPLPGERVVGFVTRGYGMTVHTADCANVQRLDPERCLEVEWGGGESAAHPVKIKVLCDDRKGILANITQTLAGFDVNVARADVRTSVTGQAVCSFEILVENLDRLQKILGSIRALKGVQKVSRLKT